MPKKKIVNIPWSKFEKKFLEEIKDIKIWKEIKDKIREKTRLITGVKNADVKFHKTAFFHALEDNGLSRKIVQRSNQWVRLTKEEQEIFLKVYPNGTSREVKKTIEKIYPNANSRLISHLAEYAGILGQRKHLVGRSSTIGKTKEKKSKEAKVVISKKQVLENLPLEVRQWDNPEIIQITDEAWNKSKTSLGELSRIDYFSPGFRSGLIRLECEIFASEARRFIVLNGGLIDKRAFNAKEKEKFDDIKKHLKILRAEAKTRGEKIAPIDQKNLKQRVTENLIDEAAKALSSMFPKIRKPGKKDEFIRFYVTTSPVYDGPYGNEIAKKLQSLRPDDISAFKPGNARTPVKFVDKIVESINPKRIRLPGQYHSTAAEKEIKDKEGQTAREYPDLWVVGALASAIHTPSGGRLRPYITVPASSRLEDVTIAENQIGIVSIEYPSKNDPHIARFWSLKDLVSHEREFITGIKEGAQEIHQNIVNVLKKEGGALTSGLLTRQLGFVDNEESRQKVEQALQFLVEEKASSRKTWPGIYYDPSSRLYDFHLDWIQERLRYILPKSETLQEDTFLFDGCTHAGYTTSDYKFIVKKFTEIILRHKIQTMVCLGDLTAGILHGFLCTGEVFGGLNNTEQQEFAAELRATILFAVFKERFDEYVTKNSPKTPEELEICIETVFILLLCIPGNHDLWTERDGNTALKVFEMKLRDILTYHIGNFLAEKKFPMINVAKIIRKKIILYQDVNAQHTMLSGIRLAMCHPHMPRAQTTSLRGQHAIGMYNCQITGMANFHTATIVHQWRPDLGQCVSVQVGTTAIYTPFEVRKMKVNDFGPVYLRTISHKGRILMTESAFYNEPILQKAIPKSTDINVLRKELGLITT